MILTSPRPFIIPGYSDGTAWLKRFEGIPKSSSKPVIRRAFGSPHTLWQSTRSAATSPSSLVQEVVDDGDALACVERHRAERDVGEIGERRLVFVSEVLVVRQDERRVGRHGESLDRVSLLMKDNGVRLELVEAVEDLRQGRLRCHDPGRRLHLFERRAAKGDLQDRGRRSLIGIETLHAVASDANLNRVLHEERDLRVGPHPVRDEQAGPDSAAENVNAPGGSREIVERKLPRGRHLVCKHDESSHGDRV